MENHSKSVCKIVSKDTEDQMKMTLYNIITIVRRMRTHWYTFLFKRMLHSYGSVGVNNFCKVARTVKVDVGYHLNSNGLIITGTGGGKNW